jgi:hypothetical protein
MSVNRRNLPLVPAHAAANGCDEELDGWCNKWCPKGETSPYAARRLVPTRFGKGLIRWWGCFPRASVVDMANGSSALRGDASEYTKRHCGRHSLKERGFFMTLEQRHLVRIFRVCTTARAQAGLRPGVSPEVLARQRADAFLAARGTLSTAIDPSVAAALARAQLGARASSQRARSRLHTRIARLPRCADGSTLATILVGSRWGNTYLSRVGGAAGGAVSNSSSEQLGLQATLLLTLIFSIRQHEHACRRPYVLLAGANVSLSHTLSERLTALAVTVRRIEPLSEHVPSLNKLYAFLLVEAPK